MKMKKFFSRILIFSMLLSLTCSMAKASVRASDYLTDYAVMLSAGDTTGALVISYDVTATKKSDYV